MAPPTQKKLTLPKALIAQLGGEEAISGPPRKFQSRGPHGSRKELRKAARTEKKNSRHGPPPTKRTKLHSGGNSEYYEREPVAAERPLKRKRPAVAEETENKPKSILKRTKKADPAPSDDDEELSDSKPAKLTKSVKDKLAEDDEEIAALEKKLGMKGKKKLPQSFHEDGLGDLLEGLDGEEEDSDAQNKKKAKAEGDEWLEQKRAKALKLAKSKKVVEVSENEEDEEEEDDDDDDEDKVSLNEGDEADFDDGASDMSMDGPEFPDDSSEEAESELGEDLESLDENNDFDGFDSEEEHTPEKRVRENPYVAPTTGVTAAAKYIPPSLRNAASSDSEALVRLRRRTQGLVNRLTEANLITILGDIEGLYRDNPRQHVTSVLVDILLTSVCEPTSLPDTLIILPAGFIAAIYKVIGIDFGAQVIQRIVELFDEHYERAISMSKDGPAAATSDSSKETSNLIMLLSEMYNFQIVGSNLIFDYVRLFLGKLTELNAELLLKIIRTSGPQLRQDDPSSLKDIVLMLRPAVAKVGEDNISVRTKFMIETINDLKNNKMKTGGAAASVTSEHTIRMKKMLGTLNTRTIKGSEPLRIGLKDIQESDKKGKWWLVGASWAGNDDRKDGDDSTSIPSSSKAPVEDSGTSDLAQLAREHRMNTDIRRAIFITIMSATDYQDAYMRLMKLKLKKVQEFEIPKVLIHCSGSEKSYNPYYTLIAKRVCGDRKLKTAFQYCLWDLFKKMGESDDDEEVEEEDEDALDMRHMVNLAKMFGTLMVEGAIGLGALKNLNMSYLQPKTKTFLEVLFITVLLQTQKQAVTKRDEAEVVKVFARAKETPQMIRQLQYFMKKVVRKTDIAGGKEETATVKWACKVAGDTLEALMAIDATKD